VSSSESAARPRTTAASFQPRFIGVELTERRGGPAALADVARVVAVHPRTLQKALGDEGLSFAEGLDCVRRERSRALLTGTDLPFTEISARLGFAEPAVLTRCARRWWARSPSQMRAG
jgi:AraC-like DNA-binding protein